MTPQAEFGPDVGDDDDEVGEVSWACVEPFKPTDEDHDPDRVLRDASRNALIAKGAALATSVGFASQANGPPRSYAGQRDPKGRLVHYFGPTLADALIALAEACDAT